MRGHQCHQRLTPYVFLLFVSHKRTHHDFHCLLIRNEHDAEGERNIAKGGTDKELREMRIDSFFGSIVGKINTVYYLLSYGLV